MILSILVLAAAIPVFALAAYAIGYAQGGYDADARRSDLP